MGKDKDGKSHPPKGGSSLEKTVVNAGVTPINSSAFQQRSEIAEKYTVGEEEPAPHLNIRHRNRNTDKHEERLADKANEKKAMVKKQVPAARSSEKVFNALPPVLQKSTLSELSGYHAEHCISVFLPTHPGGAEVNEQMDHAAFKTLIRQIVARLKQDNLKSDTIENILRPAYDLLQDDGFWRTLSQGLAVFVAENFFQYVMMPVAPKAEYMIKRSFQLSPLLPVLTTNDYFYLLVLSKKQAKFYRADAFGMIYIPVNELPDGVADVVHFEEKDDQKLFRTGSSGAGGGANYHGIGSGKPDDKENIAMYFDAVDKTLFKEILHSEHVPLLLAGVDYLIPIYRQVAQYKPIWDDAIVGNHEHDDMQTLYRMAKEKMQPYFDERHKKALELYANCSGTSSLTSFFPEDVIPAAFYKRVWHLFVQREQHLWGTFDEMNNKLVLHDTPQAGDEDLIDKASIKTLLNAGEVHLLPQDKMPGRSPIAALMRY